MSQCHHLNDSDECAECARLAAVGQEPMTEARITDTDIALYEETWKAWRASPLPKLEFDWFLLREVRRARQREGSLEAEVAALVRVMLALPGTREYDASWAALSEPTRARLRRDEKL